MQVYIYAADLYCDDCGELFREDLHRKGLSPAGPDDEGYYDSDEYPKGPYPDGGGESDCPQHCGSGADCVNAIELSDGRKIGDWLGNPLTAEGVRYVRESMETEMSEVVQLWADWYRDELDT